MEVYREYPEVLYVFENLIRSVAEEDESLLDLHVLDALVAARRATAAAAEGRSANPKLTDERTSELFHVLRAAAALLLGEDPPEVELVGTEKPDPVSPEVLDRCFRQLEKSVKLWNAEGGRQGYLEFIRQHLP
jgi:hypothetical protein